MQNTNQHVYVKKRKLKSNLFNVPTKRKTFLMCDVTPKTLAQEFPKTKFHLISSIWYQGFFFFFFGDGEKKN